MKARSDFDMNKDGTVTQNELQSASDILEIQLREEKAESQKRMAWVAMISMIIFTASLFLPIISPERVSALADLLGLFYIAQAGVVGAYMGVTAWMSNTSTRANRGVANRHRYDDIDTPDHNLR
jgi:hypothetical protein